jgi:L-ascorbate metabolism protein UlaG (beta-lactamase superfamily)
MKITKLGHCCLLIEEAGKTILTDPGSFTDTQNSITGIDLVVISHEHGDHLHVDSLKQVIAHNPDAIIVTNSGVGKILDAEGIVYQVLEGTSKATIHDILIEAFDGKHEEIFEEIGQVQNTGYMFAGRLFYPGDSFKNPERLIEILALPVAGPWCRLPDAIRYALTLKPQKAFPVHDAVLKHSGMAHTIPQKVLTTHGIEFVPMDEGDSRDF